MRRLSRVIALCLAILTFSAVPGLCSVTVSNRAVDWFEYSIAVDAAAENLLSFYRALATSARTRSGAAESLLKGGRTPGGLEAAIRETVGEDITDRIFPEWPAGTVGTVRFRASPAQFFWILPLRGEGLVLVESSEMDQGLSDRLDPASLNFIVEIDITLPEDFPAGAAAAVAARHPGMIYVKEGEKLTFNIFPSAPEIAEMLEDLLDTLSR